jgi:nucleoside-diphosphate-sugar epimerase
LQTVLITGANGFVGSHLCEQFLIAGFRVKALVRKTSNLSNLKNLDIQYCYGDLNSADSLPDAVRGADIIINNAGITKALNLRRFEIVNAIGTLNIAKAAVEHAPKLSRFIQISSTAAVGPSTSLTPLTEASEPHPLTSYGRSKLAGEKIILSYADKFPVTILRPSAVYGPRDKEMLSFFKIIKFGIKPTFGFHDNYINFSYITDLARAAVKAAQFNSPSGAIYTIAENKYYSYREVSDIIGEILGRRGLNLKIPVSILFAAGLLTDIWTALIRKPEVFSLEKAREISQRFWIFDTSNIENELQFKGFTSFPQGAKDTIKWYHNAGWL